MVVKVLRSFGTKQKGRVLRKPLPTKVSQHTTQLSRAPRTRGLVLATPSITEWLFLLCQIRIANVNAALAERYLLP